MSYRIEYSLQREAADGEFEEFGFGSSGTWDDLNAALHAMSSDIECEQWEVSE